MTERGTHRIVKMLRSGYAWIVVGMLARSALQAAMVVLLARTLGAADYGLVVAIASVTGIAAVFSGLGSTTLHLRDLSVGKVNASASYAFAIKRILVTFAPLGLATLAVAWLLYGKHIGPVSAACLVLGELFAFAMSDLLQRTMQGHNRFAAMAFYMALVPFLRCAALGLVLLAGMRFDIGTWVVICLGSGCVPLVIALIGWHRLPRGNRAHGAVVEHRLVEGLGFAVSAGSIRTHADADKAIVAGFSSLDAAAQYSVAYRLFDVLMLPIISFIEWRMSSLFRSGASAHGLSALRANRSFVLAIAGASIAMSLISLPLVGLLPLLLGEAYAASATMGRYLALLPMTASLWWIFRTMLGTTGDQAAGAAIELSGAAMNVVLTIALVIPMGWMGAIVGTYATHVIMSVAAVIVLGRRSRRNASCA
jgi:O-antigen/teichoic acid export membrane protein